MSVRLRHRLQPNISTSKTHTITFIMHFIKEMYVIRVTDKRISPNSRTEEVKKYSEANVFRYVRQAVLVQKGQLGRFVLLK